ncbi:plasmid maintenance system antidote protein [bacterium]|nr:MAG: plasmid maintenance system antidote protein [bacterium]
MQPHYDKYIGIHPGLVLERELKKRTLKKRAFAITLGEYPQIINEITKGRRGVPPMLSLKIDQMLKLEEGTFHMLQAHYDLLKAKKNLKQQDSPSFRKVLFWDTEIEKIDWKKQYKAVIKRVFERGNYEEKIEALRLYGKDKIQEITGSSQIIDNAILVMANAKHD